MRKVLFLGFVLVHLFIFSNSIISIDSNATSTIRENEDQFFIDYPMYDLELKKVTQIGTFTLFINKNIEESLQIFNFEINLDKNYKEIYKTKSFLYNFYANYVGTLKEEFKDYESKNNIYELFSRYSFSTISYAEDSSLDYKPPLYKKNYNLGKDFEIHIDFYIEINNITILKDDVLIKNFKE